MRKIKAPSRERLKRAYLAFRQSVESELVKAVKKERDRFVEEIEAQNFTAFKEKPLSPAYAKRKKALGLDPRTMIATRRLIETMQVYTRRKDGALQIRIGHHVRQQARDHKGNVRPLRQIDVDRIQEEGSEKANIPDRPHWSVQAKRLRQHLPAICKSVAKDAVARARKTMEKR